MEMAIIRLIEVGKMTKSKSNKNRKLTGKEVAFANLVVEGELTDHDIHAAVYKTKGNKATISRDAHTVRYRPHVAEYIRIQQEKIAQTFEVTAESLIIELEEARQMAKKEMSGSGMTAATMGKARICGLDKKIVEIKNAEELTPWSSVKAGE